MTPNATTCLIPLRKLLKTCCITSARDCILIRTVQRPGWLYTVFGRIHRCSYTFVRGFATSAQSQQRLGKHLLWCHQRTLSRFYSNSALCASLFICMQNLLETGAGNSPLKPRCPATSANDTPCCLACTMIMSSLWLALNTILLCARFFVFIDFKANGSPRCPEVTLFFCAKSLAEPKGLRLSWSN